MSRASILSVVGIVVVMTAGSLHAQYDCSADTTEIMAHNILRQSGNDVFSFAQSYVEGVYWDFWQPEVTSTEKLNGNVLLGRSNVVASAGYGGVATNEWTDLVSGVGTGTFTMNNTHRFIPDPYWCGNPVTTGSTSDLITVRKPEVDTLGLTGIWWLGGGADPANGLYNAMVLKYKDDSSPLPPGTPYWSIVAGSDKARLDCSSCSDNVLTSTGPSGACTDFVKVTVSIGGLPSDPKDLLMNRPRYRVSWGSPTYDEWPYADGWETHIYYRTLDLCGYEFQSIALNETFPSGWQGDVTNNWLKPAPGGSPGYAGTAPVWFDKARMTTQGCSFQPCFPMPTPWPGTNVISVDRALQYWYFGSASPGQGVFVDSNVAVRFTDHAEHQFQ